MIRRNHPRRSLRSVGHNDPPSQPIRALDPGELRQITEAVADILDGARDSELAMHILSPEEVAMLERLRDVPGSATSADHNRLTLLALHFYQERGRTNLV